ncbi:OmpA family protein [Ekhidna sp.]|uniref:OmpA family protein n=1 Tax=Ekhidna sp. TaxID=2608089 RepID=UPI003516577B
MRFVFINIAIFSCLLTEAQVTFKTLRAADDAFGKYSYAKAADLYDAALEDAEDSLYIHQQMALCYRNMNDTKQSEKYLEKVVKDPASDAEFYYLYAQALSSNGKYDQAKEWYGRYQNKVANDPRANEKLAALDDFHQFFSDSSKFTIERLEFNSPGLDFSPAIYDSSVVFASSRPSGNKWVKTNFNWDESEFLDLYMAKKGETEATRFIQDIQTKYHEGPLAFYDNDQKVVFTRNNLVGKRLKKDDQGVTRLKLFFAESDGEGGWKNTQPFKYNSDDYSVGHPAINDEGTVLIFSSDMPGGFGESDLYVSYKEGDGWSQPKNLGERVNTAGKEMFPSLVASNLYFASDGKGGLGGLDIFEATLDNRFMPRKVSNVGYPINSSKDDFGLVSNDRFRSGYFTSARVDSLKDDIYYFERDFYILRGIAYNQETNEPLEGVDLFIEDGSGQLIYRRSKENGEFAVEDISPAVWKVSGVKNNYRLVDEKKITIKDGDEVESLVEVYFVPVPKFPVDLPASVADFIAVVGTGADSLSGEYSVGQALSINPIYYDFDKSELRVVGKEELEKLIIFMDQHPSLIISLSSHTDKRGPDKYNLLLSQRRANAAFDYLVERGVDPSRLQATGNGEANPQVECEPCTKEQHQLNRRTEFLITGIKE